MLSHNVPNANNVATGSPATCPTSWSLLPTLFNHSSSSLANDELNDNLNSYAFCSEN
jgi:hypothetical protein